LAYANPHPRQRFRDPPIRSHRIVCDVTSAARIEPQPKPNGRTAEQFGMRARNHHERAQGGEPHGVRPPAPRKPKSNGTAAHLALRREARDRDDENLRQAMCDSPQASIADWAKAIGKSRSSTVTALHRLRDAGLATNADKVWALVEPGAPREPPPKWVAPLSALSAASHTHI
jgi:hypothetical protein